MLLRIAIGVLAFAATMADAGDTPRRPCSGPEYASMDFWIGTWNVVNGRGELEGHNRIEKVLNGCAIIEN